MKNLKQNLSIEIYKISLNIRKRCISLWEIRKIRLKWIVQNILYFMLYNTMCMNGREVSWEFRSTDSLFSSFNDFVCIKRILEKIHQFIFQEITLGGGIAANSEIPLWIVRLILEMEASKDEKKTRKLWRGNL